MFVIAAKGAIQVAFSFLDSGSRRLSPAWPE
jgi:hypothetical protein